MRFVDTARIVVAVMVIACHPPGILLWFAVHPFAAFWRRLGAVWTYAILGVPTIGLIIGAVLLRKPLLMRDLGTSWVTIALAVPCLATALLINRQRSRQLNFGKLSGLPELSQDGPGTLLTQGIYSRLRHPRYVEVTLWVLGYALFANYLGAYVVLALSVPLILGVVVLEERELRQRFGEAYEAYCRRVPRFIPRRRPPNHDDTSA